MNHEYGLVLIFTGAVGGLLFILYWRSTFSKICLSCIAVWMSVLVTMTSSKVKTRIMVMNNLSNAWDNGNLLGGEATQLYYFFLRVKGAGFYGFASGQLSERLYPTALNDYVFTTLIYNHGLLTGFLAFLLATAMCRAILRSHITERSDGIMNQGTAIIIGAIYIL
jgi:cell division protein FtsW (lipid II flippase)